jgi:hypothetical protein
MPPGLTRVQRAAKNASPALKFVLMVDSAPGRRLGHVAETGAKKSGLPVLLLGR